MDRKNVLIRRVPVSLKWERNSAQTNAAMLAPRGLLVSAPIRAVEPVRSAPLRYVADKNLGRGTKCAHDAKGFVMNRVLGKRIAEVAPASNVGTLEIGLLSCLLRLSFCRLWPAFKGNVPFK